MLEGEEQEKMDLHSRKLATTWTPANKEPSVRSSDMQLETHARHAKTDDVLRISPDGRLAERHGVGSPGADGGAWILRKEGPHSPDIRLSLTYLAEILYMHAPLSKAY